MALGKANFILGFDHRKWKFTDRISRVLKPSTCDVRKLAGGRADRQRARQRGLQVVRQVGKQAKGTLLPLIR
jgi:hypothetical protein